MKVVNRPYIKGGKLFLGNSRSVHQGGFLPALGLAVRLTHLGISLLRKGQKQKKSRIKRYFKCSFFHKQLKN